MPTEKFWSPAEVSTTERTPLSAPMSSTTDSSSFMKAKDIRLCGGSLIVTTPTAAARS